MQKLELFQNNILKTHNQRESTKICQHLLLVKHILPDNEKSRTVKSSVSKKTPMNINATEISKLLTNNIEIKSTHC